MSYYSDYRKAVRYDRATAKAILAEIRSSRRKPKNSAPEKGSRAVFPAQSFWAKITARDSDGKYDWQQVTINNAAVDSTTIYQTGSVADGNYATEIRGCKMIPIGSIVELHCAYDNGNFVFAFAGGIMGIADGDIPPRSSLDAGSGTMDLYRITDDAGTLEMYDTITVYNVAPVKATSGRWIQCKLVIDRWVVDMEACS